MWSSGSDQLVLVDALAGLFENVNCSVKVAPKQKFLPLVDGFLRKAAEVV